MSRIVRSFAVLVLLLSGWFGVQYGSSPAIAQSAADSQVDQPTAGEPFFEVVDVEIVNIDVWVTDQQGDPVEGLAKDDFVVYRDGQPIEVTNFYAVSGGRSALSGAPDLATPAPVPNEDRSLMSSGLEVAPEHRLWLIVYVDNYNIDPVERNRVLPALRLFLGRMLRGGDQAMLVSYSRSLKVHQPFTDESSLLRAALDEIRDDAGHAVGRKRDQLSTLERIDKAEDSSTALLYARLYAEELMNGVDYTVDALQRFIDTLGGLPGRKALLHVSSGVPMLAGEEMFHAVAEKFNVSEPYAEIARHDTSRRFERVNRHASANRVTFYTLDAGGLRGMEFGAAEYPGFVDPRLRSTLDSVVPENLQAPLRLMAIETGGQAILNRNEVLPALEQAAQDFRSFYSLGISSTGAVEGRYHEIEVKLRERRKGVLLRHRAGYRGKGVDTRVREGLRSALLYSHQSNPLNVKVLWGRPQPQGDGRYLLPIRLEVPLRDVALLPVMTGKHEARLKLFVGAVGKDGEASEIEETPFGFRLADEHVEAAKGESLVHDHKLLLNPGRKKVGVAILDLFGGQTSVVTRFLDVGPGTASPKPDRGSRE